LHNGKTKRKGHLWEDRFKSVIVEDGVAAKTMAACINLNPVRAGMVENPEDYRWSSYGEAIGSREFVNEAFAGARERFGPKRKDGARSMRGSGKPAAGLLWSMRDLRVEIG
jgi:hypothetical protein